MKDTTFIVSAFERPEALKACLDSIREHYPSVKILVADDSTEPKPIKQKNVDYYPLPFDMGLSYKRNFLVKLVRTPYMVVLDDDFVFTKDTKIERLRTALKKHNLDIVAGNVVTKGEVVHYEGLLELKNKKLRFIKGDRGTVGNVTLYDLVLNFFIAKTDSLRKYPWDNDLKIAEHAPYFLSIKDKLKVGHLEGVLVENSNKSYGDKVVFRQRDEFTQIFMHKEDIKEIINFGGTKKRRKEIVKMDTKNYVEKMENLGITRSDFDVVKSGNRSDIYLKDKRVGRVVGGDDVDVERKIRYIMEAL